MVKRATSGVMPWLLVAVIALIGYGSLYPFHFVFDGRHPTVNDAVAQLTWARAGRADQVRNVLLYVPFGFCLMLWLRGRMHVLWAVLLATLGGAALSFAIELAQVYLSMRVPSWLDLSLNTAGTLSGAVSGMLWRRLSALVYLPPHNRQQPGDRSALVVLAAWIVWRMSEFDVHPSLARLKQALSPLLDWQFSWLLMLKFLLLWLVVAQAVYGYAQRHRGNEVLLTIMAIVLAGRLLLVTPAFIPAELVALVLLLPTLVLLHRVDGHLRHVTQLLLFAGYFLLDQLAPLNWRATPGTFDFWPFLGWMQAGMPIHLEFFAHQVFLYSALIWLLKDAGLSLRQAWLIAGVLVLGVELLHLWQSERTASLTNPALAAAVGWLMQSISQSSRRSRYRYR